MIKTFGDKRTQELYDLPVWVETRALLMRQDSNLLENPNRKGFVVWNTGVGLGSVVGQPEPEAVVLAAGDVTEILAFAENIDYVRSLLPEFEAEPATIFSAPQQLPAAPRNRGRKISLSEITAQDHLPADLVAELSRAMARGVPVVAAFDDVLPVSFAYVAAETESLWDISIDTIQSHRRQGYATTAVVYLMRVMKERGKFAVWGALESNRASANLARKLGFVKNDRLWVLTRSTT